ncbi:MAG: hypothetical protein KDK76_02615 [Chlamydiia bacterium]|nr:hypothetical protein [Chlamydiia bacterium]
MILSHRAIQKVMVEHLPEAVTEHRFPSIQRIADVVYFPKKIIFEVQCSPISLGEVQRRNRDYSSLGFTVIWILHDRIYNKKIITPAELYLRQNLSYYTSITPFGHGFFYDQLDFFKEMERVYQSAPYLLKDLLPRPLTKTPLLFPRKLKRRPFYLPGDATDLLIKENLGKWAWKIERKLFQKWTLKKIMNELLHSLLYSQAAPKNVLSSHKD